MKKIILTASFLFIFLFISAQRHDHPTVGQRVDYTIKETEEALHRTNFGAKAGLNIAGVSGKASHKAGFYAGAYGMIPVNKGLFIQPELLLSRQGYGKSPTESISNMYLKVPVMFKYFLHHCFYLEIGPEISFLLSDGDTKKKTNSFDFGLAGGLGYKVGKYINLPGLEINARYSLGLRDTEAKNNVSTALPATGSVVAAVDSIPGVNLVFQIGLAYNF